MTTNVAPPSRQKIQAQTASARNKVTGALKIALDLIIHEGLNWEDAATQAKLQVRTMRLAMRRPHVLQYLRAERQVLLASVVAQNPRRLQQLRDQDDNRAAAVRAAATLEAMHDSPTAQAGAMNVKPGLTIQIIADAPPRVVGPVIEHDDKTASYRGGLTEPLKDAADLNGAPL
jgi:hypothetical protein